jgi:LCP family protein required for cell wall assembly
MLGRYTPRMAERPPDKPEYNVYRSKRGLRDRLAGPRDQAAQLREAARRRTQRERKDDDLEPQRERGPKGPLWRRILKWVAIAAVGWVLLSLVLFMVSAQITDGVSEETENALSSGGSLLTGSTILVLGSDERPEDTLEPGVAGLPARADSILLMHVGFGSVRKLSVLRDSPVDIPGHGLQKINAAYAFGGAPLMIKTVEAYLGNGLEINHIIEVSFEDFPEFIDALGGIDVKVPKGIRSNSFGGRRVKLSKGEHHLDGKDALAYARVRKNELDLSEDDRTRAARQQQVLSAIRSQILSPSTFFRLPLVSWEAPQTIRSDLQGPGLLALFTDLLTGGSGKTNVLECLPCTEEEKAEAVDDLIG